MFGDLHDRNAFLSETYSGVPKKKISVKIFRFFFGNDDKDKIILHEKKTFSPSS